MLCFAGELSFSMHPRVNRVTFPPLPPFLHFILSADPDRFGSSSLCQRRIRIIAKSRVLKKKHRIRSDSQCLPFPGSALACSWGSEWASKCIRIIWLSRIAKKLSRSRKHSEMLWKLTNISLESKIKLEWCDEKRAYLPPVLLTRPPLFISLAPPVLFCLMLINPSGSIRWPLRLNSYRQGQWNRPTPVCVAWVS